MKLKGRLWIFPDDNISTDQIFPGKYTYQPLTNEEMKYLIQGKKNDENLNHESIDSIFLLCLKYYEIKYGFDFEEEDILNEIVEIKDLMAKMWLNFKERYFSFATKELNQLSMYSINSQNYDLKVSKILDKLLK